MTDGRMLFTSSAARRLGKDVWLMNADGTKRRQQTGSGYNEYPVVTPDGMQLVFSRGAWVSDVALLRDPGGT
jgi:Tol biopolymer transport system component